MANTEKKAYTLTVYNTTSGIFEEISVSKGIYNEYRRGEWRISKNDDRHKANETPFSSLIGGADGSCENFDEFISDKNNPSQITLKSKKYESLHKAIESLPEKERVVIELFFFNQLSSREIGEIIGITQQAVTKRRRSAFRKIKKFLKKIKDSVSFF